MPAREADLATWVCEGQVEIPLGGTVKDGTYKPTRAPGPPGTAKVFRNETALVKVLIDQIRAMPEAWARKVHGSRYQDAGEPDVDACVRGRSVKIEVKMPGGAPTAVQMGALRRWQNAGALVGWATSREHVVEILEHCGDLAWRNELTSPGDGRRGPG